MANKAFTIWRRLVSCLFKFMCLVHIQLIGENVSFLHMYLDDVFRTQLCCCLSIVNVRVTQQSIGFLQLRFRIQYGEIVRFEKYRISYLQRERNRDGALLQLAFIGQGKEDVSRVDELEVEVQRRALTGIGWFTWQAFAPFVIRACKFEKQGCCDKVADGLS